MIGEPVRCRRRNRRRCRWGSGCGKADGVVDGGECRYVRQRELGEGGQLLGQGRELRVPAGAQGGEGGGGGRLTVVGGVEQELGVVVAVAQVAPELGSGCQRDQAGVDAPGGEAVQALPVVLVVAGRVLVVGEPLLIRRQAFELGDVHAVVVDEFEFVGRGDEEIAVLEVPVGDAGPLQGADDVDQLAGDRQKVARLAAMRFQPGHEPCASTVHLEQGVAAARDHHSVGLIVEVDQCRVIEGFEGGGDGGVAALTVGVRADEAFDRP